ILERRGELGEALAERGGEQEREQHLHTGQDDSELVQQLEQLPVEPFGRALPICHGNSRTRAATADQQLAPGYLPDGERVTPTGTPGDPRGRGGSGGGASRQAG